jgi:hypothetical protein
MNTITTAHTTLTEFIEQMRLLGLQNRQEVKIQYNSEQARAAFYVKGALVDTRKLFRV